MLMVCSSGICSWHWGLLCLFLTELWHHQFYWYQQFLLFLTCSWHPCGVSTGISNFFTEICPSQICPWNDNWFIVLFLSLLPEGKEKSMGKSPVSDAFFHCCLSEFFKSFSNMRAFLSAALMLVRRPSARCHVVRSSCWLLACGCRLSLMLVHRQSVRCRLVSIQSCWKF